VQFARITPEHLALLSLHRAADAIDQVTSDPTGWVFVILDLHRALNCALVAALSGTAGIGAFDEELRAGWISHFETGSTPPSSEHVLAFLRLLEQAQIGTTEMRGGRLKLTAEERADLNKLNGLRGDLEHVKPKSWSLDVAGLPRISGVAGRAFGRLMPSFAHHLELNEIEVAETTIAKLEARGA
jgi:hypothetical protein